MKHLLKLADLTAEEIFGILNLADQLKYERKNNIRHPAATPFSFPTAIFSWGGESLSRIPCACFPAISTGS